MKLHEYQAKELMRKYGIPVPRGIVAESPDAAVAAARVLNSDVCVVKAQAYTGGRGKAGGVQLCRSHDEIERAAEDLLDSRIVTKQTGPAGLPVSKVYIEEGTNIDKELYLSMLLNRDTSRIVVVASTEGGMDIEEVAAKTPSKIMRLEVNPMVGAMPYEGRKIGFSLGLHGEQIDAFVTLYMAMYRAYVELDAELIEINPLVVTTDGRLQVLDTKLAIDNNALFRHPAIAELIDHEQLDPKEVEAKKHNLNYVALDGRIGCMVNGAGLAMATMDIIHHFGEAPANFLDVGGSATEDRVTAAFKIILSDPKVAGILVNIFGGIMKCDVIANGVIAAARQVQLTVPLVVRLEGTNVDEGKRILSESGLPILSADSLADAAQKIISAVNQ